jgi:tight adherence protein C
MLTLLLFLSGFAGSGFLFCILWPVANASSSVQTEYRPRFWRWASLPIAAFEFSVVRILPNALISKFSQLLGRSGLRLDLSASGLAAGCLVAGAILGSFAIGLYALGYAPLWVIGAFAMIGFSLPILFIRSKALQRESQISRQLPFTLDLITLAVESGLNLTGAIHETVAKGPAGPLRDELAVVTRDMRTGVARSVALQLMAERLRLPAVNHFVGGLVAAEKQGAALGALLRAQATARRNERFSLAEKLAMQAPVKMLFPLIVFIFPCTFIVLFFPVFSQLTQEGWLK